MQQSPSCPTGQQKHRGEEKGRRFRQPVPSSDTPGHGKAPCALPSRRVTTRAAVQRRPPPACSGLAQPCPEPGEGSLCLRPVLTCKASFSVLKSCFFGSKPVFYDPQPCISLSHPHGIPKGQGWGTPPSCPASPLKVQLPTPRSHVVVANGRAGEMRGCGHIRGGTIWGRRL